jgi:hypothetical protein
MQNKIELNKSIKLPRLVAYQCYLSLLMKWPNIIASSNHFTFIINFIENVKSEVMISKLRTVELAPIK